MKRRERIRDEILVLSARAGDGEAFRTLVDRFQPRLWRHALRLTGREDAAWNVMQEAWMAISRGLSKLNDASMFRRWAYTIVTRRASDLYEKRANEDGALSLNEEALAPPEEELDPRGEIDLLRRALRLLPGERRALLSLFYLEGFQVVELAEILGVPEGTVKSRLHHARNELRAIVERIDT